MVFFSVTGAGGDAFPGSFPRAHGQALTSPWRQKRTMRGEDKGGRGRLSSLPKKTSSVPAVCLLSKMDSRTAARLFSLALFPFREIPPSRAGGPLARNPSPARRWRQRRPASTLQSPGGAGRTGAGEGRLQCPASPSAP